ncbi:glycosyltransferase family 9 protein [uncultured Selenomonas sp.]|uniref:glycosyltransferase family 9 protein n=1 Tax=uncultured Selenomonas sp. TaxID=159275 RepID=UPI0025D26C6F|nr:glycosyltransferase family 9 protein [uncultured Selenomonas sp.]
MTPKNILIIKLSSIGDVVHALPVSYELKQKWPDCRITWVVEPASRGIVEMDACVDDIIIFEKQAFRSVGGFLHHFGPLKRAIQSRRYDLVLDLQGLFKSAAIAYLAKAPKGRKLGPVDMREGSDHVSRPVRGPHAKGHVIERYLDVVRSIGCNVPYAPDGSAVHFPIEVPTEAVAAAAARFRQAGADMKTPYITIPIGANWPTKRWPEENIAAFANLLYDHELIPVLVGGGPVDEARAARITGLMDIPPVELVGKLTFPELAAAFQHAAATVGPDTGICHLSIALGTPTLMLMGPTIPERTGPYGPTGHLLMASHHCVRCFKRACPKGLDCLADITAEQAWRETEKILR